MKGEERFYEEALKLLPKQHGHVAVENRRMLEALVSISRNGCSWRALPEKFGKWNTIYKRFNRWAHNGVFEKLCTAMREAHLNVDALETVSLDSTFVKVHPDAAGAPKKTVLSP
jgi:transposase